MTEEGTLVRYIDNVISDLDGLSEPKSFIRGALYIRYLVRRHELQNKNVECDCQDLKLAPEIQGRDWICADCGAFITEANPPDVDAFVPRDDEWMRDDKEAAMRKRQKASHEFGYNCPVCEEPFDTGSSGAAFTPNSCDVRSHVRACYGPIPPCKQDSIADTICDDQDLDTVSYVYIHKDEHLGADDE